ncbi:heterokaryon incompatibility protein-domain-containing protein [Rhexocercosporidium sp. MPI-PUGE-AT-0058]|nr:heterokaryon incompatibility protein-domain-containing protein [Rhexocercosporidium sp. MPI-PUGE-AT-0058]
MECFRYTPLQRGRKIRVLETARGEGNWALKVKLVHVDLDENPGYSALSYVWGSGTDRTKIECNGREVEVTKNLAEALRHLQHESESRYLWVDALCINQQDMEEKGHQVALMKDIYAYAKEVVVWLGPDEEDIAAELFKDIEEVLNSLEASIEESFEDLDGLQWLHYDGTPSPVMEKLFLLFKREYFARTWVIQEVGLTNRPFAHWGKSVVNFNKIGLVAMAGLKYFRPTLSSFGYLKEFERVANLYQAYLPRPGPQRLCDIIHRTRLNQVTDSRDKIYAFISHPSARQNTGDFPYKGKDMLSDENMTDEDIKFRTLSVILSPTQTTWDFASLEHIGKHPLRPPSPDEVKAKRMLHNPGPGMKVPRYWRGSSFITPDYNLSVVDAYLDFARQMITRTESLEVLSFVQHNAPLPPTGPGFPSWVPRWDTPTDVSILGGVTCDHFAAANRRPIITPSPDRGSLTVRGLFFDRIGLHTIPLTREDFNDDSKTSPLWTMSKTCRVSTHPVPEYPRIYVAGVPMMQDPDRLKAYIKTWTGGRTTGTNDAPRDGFNPEADFAAYELDFFKRKFKDQPSVDVFLKMAELEEESRGGNGERFAEVAGSACHGRSFFITKAGFFGIGPGIVEQGDSVVILLGADVPFIVREKEKCGDNFGGYALIGECYVHGLMTGDAIRAWGGPDGDLKDIILC